MNNQPKQNAQETVENHEAFSKSGIILIGIYFIILAVLLIYLFISFWPKNQTETLGSQPGQTQEIASQKEAQSGPQQEAANPENEKNIWARDVRLFWFKFEISAEVRLIILVLIAGALGSYIHIATSFVDFVGNKKLKRSWLWWYILRPFSGSILALIFYMIIRGGLLAGQIEGTALSRYGVTGLSGLIGLFSKQAIDKLNEVFNTLFSTKDKDQRKDKLNDAKE